MDGGGQLGLQRGGLLLRLAGVLRQHLVIDRLCRGLHVGGFVQIVRRDLHQTLQRRRHLCIRALTEIEIVDAARLFQQRHGLREISAIGEVSVNILDLADEFGILLIQIRKAVSALQKRLRNAVALVIIDLCRADQQLLARARRLRGEVEIMFPGCIRIQRQRHWLGKAVRVLNYCDFRSRHIAHVWCSRLHSQHREREAGEEHCE